MELILTSRQYRRRFFFLRLLKYIFLFVIGIANLFPFYWTVLSSIKDNNEILVNPFALPQKIWKFSNYTDAWRGAKLASNFVNTVIVTAVAVMVILLIASMAAYIISRVRPSFLLYAFFTLGIMIPVQAMIVPLFIELNLFGLTNTRIGLIIVYVAVNMSLSIFILYGFLITLPKELEDAALVDGCSNARTFFRIILPISQPGLATVGIFAVLACWNEYLIPLVLITEHRIKVISQGIQNLKSAFITDYGLVCAGIIIAVLPVIVIYVLFQEQVIKGMTAGALKG